MPHSLQLKILQEEGQLKSVYVLKDGGTIPEPDTDFAIVQQGYISVSRIYADPVCNEIVDDKAFLL